MSIYQKFKTQIQFPKSKSIFLDLCYLYLMLPLIIFCVGWYKPLISFLVLGILLWVFLKIRSSNFVIKPVLGFFTAKNVLAVLILCTWVFLSGIGGYAFQNPDFTYRNAILRDLIQNHWPVIYTSPGQPAMELVYNIGFWLPSALVGKILGWDAANFFLFLWTCLGVILVAHLISIRVETSIVKTSLFLILFSGMDAVGVLAVQIITSQPSTAAFWPPYQHLEWWARSFQFSSFTTQLFWVFNQALPAWICTGLLLNGVKERQMFFLWCLCFFFAPLPALGLIFLMIAVALQPGLTSFIEVRFLHWHERVTYWFGYVVKLIFKFMSFENIVGGGAVLVLSYVYFHANQNVSIFSINFGSLYVFLFTILFLILEGGLIWLLLRKNNKNNFVWFVIGLSLFFSPFIKVGIWFDFAMRASIPALFSLMILCCEYIFSKCMPLRSKFNSITLIAILAIGSLTPIFEINRSIYRTASYYLCQSSKLPPCTEPELIVPVTGQDDGQMDQPENAPPDSLIADERISVYIPNSPVPVNFVAELDQSALSRLLLKFP